MVVGAGPAGLATAVLLRRRGIDAVIHDRGASVGGSWPDRYDSLRLNTVRWMSDLPGLRMQRRLGRWVARDDVVAYLRSYADWHRLEIVSGSEVERLGPAASRRWEVGLDGDRRVLADAVVVATGHSARPTTPDWPGASRFRGEVLHSSQYRRPDNHLGRRVVVAGAGSSGGEIVVDLLGAGIDVTWSIRTPRWVVPREIGPVPTTPLGAVADLLPDRLVDAAAPWLERSAYGPRDYLPQPTHGLTEDLARWREPMTADGVVAAIRDGRVRVVGPVADLAADGVVLDDGARVAADVVVAATGYEPGLERLVGGLGVLGGDGRPLDPLPRRGLGFVGFRIALGGTLWAIEHDARLVARDLLG